MRALALLLIVANLGYLGWATWVDSPPTTMVAPESNLDALPRLVLASERVPAPGKKSRTVVNKPVESAATSSSQTAKGCMSVGPFQDLPAVAQASAVIEGAGLESKQRLEQGELWVGHWVSIADLSTHEQAQSAVERLKGRGVMDAYILPSDDRSNVISLGVFKDHERALRRMSEAKSLGLNATIADRTRSGSVYWVDVELKEGKQIPDISILATQPGKILRLETRPCAG
jgi:hypothetical protein